MNGLTPRSWADRLQALELRRAPYSTCCSQVVCQILSRRLAQTARVVELGAGAGQLKRWSRNVSIGRWLQTDPDPAVLANLKQRDPHAETSIGKADQIPAQDDSCDGVLGLCVLDVMSDLAAVVRECRRVLRENGSVIHFLDLTTLLTLPFVDVHRAGFLPLPNFNLDSGKQLWPEDLTLVSRVQFKHRLDELGRAGHALPQVFSPYWQRFYAGSFDADAAAAAFHAIADVAQRRAALERLLGEADQLGARSGWPPIEGTSVSSARHLAQRLESAFLGGGFRIDLVEVIATHSLEKRSPSHPLVYRSMCLGHERNYRRLPEAFLTNDPPRPSPTQQLVEAGLFVFIATKS